MNCAAYHEPYCACVDAFFSEQYIYFTSCNIIPQGCRKALPITDFVWQHESVPYGQAVTKTFVKPSAYLKWCRVMGRIGWRRLVFQIDGFS